MLCTSDPTVYALVRCRPLRERIREYPLVDRNQLTELTESGGNRPVLQGNGNKLGARCIAARAARKRGTTAAARNLEDRLNARRVGDRRANVQNLMVASVNLA
jgi:hypothetical protein